MINPYSTLGVSKNATEAELKQAYRKLAMENHPDKGGDQNRFAEISSAYDTLKDPQKRAAYDHFGTADPQQQRPHGFGGFQQSGQPFDLDSIFEIFCQRMHPNARRGPPDARVSMVIDLADAVRGGKRAFAVQTPNGQTSIEITIPKGVVDNENIRYPKLAPGGMDLVANFRVRAHQHWQRDGLDMHCERPIDFWQLILGTTLSITDILDRTYGLTIPPTTKPGAVMRLRNKGIEREGHNTGDLFVKLRATMPDNIDEEILKVIREHQVNK